MPNGMSRAHHVALGTRSGSLPRNETSLDSTRRQRWNKLSSLITAIINAVKFNNLNTFISIYHPEATTSAKIERLRLLLLLSFGRVYLRHRKLKLVLCSTLGLGGGVSFHTQRGKNADETDRGRFKVNWIKIVIYGSFRRELVNVPVSM